MKIYGIFTILAITGANASRRTEVNNKHQEQQRRLKQNQECFTMLANGVEFNANSAIMRSTRVDTANEARQCLDFSLNPFIRFGSTYCTGDTFAIGNVRLYDADEEDINGTNIEDFVAGLCTPYELDGMTAAGGYPTPIWVNPCPLDESIDNPSENLRAGYYSRSGTRVARVAADGLSNIPDILGGDRRNVYDVHSIHTFTFPENITAGVVSGFTSQIVAISLDGTSNGNGAGGSGSAAIVGGTGIYEGARGVVNYENFRLASATNRFEICLDPSPYSDPSPTPAPPTPAPPTPATPTRAPPTPEACEVCSDDPSPYMDGACPGSWQVNAGGKCSYPDKFKESEFCMKSCFCEAKVSFGKNCCCH